MKCNRETESHNKVFDSCTKDQFVEALLQLTGHFPCSSDFIEWNSADCIISPQLIWMYEKLLMCKWIICFNDSCIVSPSMARHTPLPHAVSDFTEWNSYALALHLDFHSLILLFIWTNFIRSISGTIAETCIRYEKFSLEKKSVFVSFFLNIYWVKIFQNRKK